MPWGVQDSVVGVPVIRYATIVTWCSVCLTIQRASHSASAAIEDVGIDHCGIEIFVPEQFLNCPDVVTRFQQVSSEAMTKRVATGVFDDA